jgi:replicative DNA helicase
MDSDILGEKTPSRLDVEEALLGAVLLDPETALPSALETGLKAEDFFHEAHAEIFRTCKGLDADRQPVDQVTVAAALKSRGILEKYGGPANLARLFDGIGVAANAGRYARIIIDQAILRRLIALSGTIIRRSQGSPLKVDKLLDWAEEKILEVRGERRADFINASEEIKNNVFKKILSLRDNRRSGVSLPGLPTGYDDLDKLTGGFQKSDLIILAARPGLGKTSLALNLALNAAIPSQRQTYRQLPPRTVAIFSLEMDQTQLLFRLICQVPVELGDGQVGHMNLKDLRTGWMADEDIVPLTAAINRLGGAQLYIDDTPALQVTELRAKARRLQNKLRGQGADLDLVVVDYLQLMRGGESGSSESREREISEISRSLKALAKELHLPVLALSQLNRDMDKRSGKDKKPRLSDLRESGAIEQDADIIAFIYSPEVHGESEDSEQGRDRQVDLLISKHRNGPTGKIPLYFKAASATFLPRTSSE